MKNGTKRFTFTLSIAEFEAMMKAAKASGLSLAGWLRMLALREIGKGKK